MKASLERDGILLVLSGLLLSACDKGKETPAPEPQASANTTSQPQATAQPEAAANTAVEAKEVPSAPSASAGGKEKKCSPGGCSPGACG